jgi:hypothetical protein
MGTDIWPIASLYIRLMHECDVTRTIAIINELRILGVIHVIASTGHLVRRCHRLVFFTGVILLHGTLLYLTTPTMFFAENDQE